MYFLSTFNATIRAARGWIADTRGTIAVTMAVMTPVLIMLVGVSMDYARAEHVRSKVQHAVDMATLALAKMSDDYDNPTRAARRFVKAALKTADIDLKTARVQAKVTKTPNSKTAQISATVSPELFFAGYFVSDNFKISVSSKAEERYRNMEISLVLDISGSMRNARIANLKTAATQFLDIVMKNELDKKHTMINVVPFGGDVSLGAHFQKFIKVGQRPGWNGCIDLKKISLTGQVLSVGAQDATPEISFGRQYVCPRSWNSALFRENDVNVLKAKINGLRALGPSTSTDMGAYWGLTGLSPDWRPHLPGPVTAAPRSLTTDVVKTLIIMTDGAINGPYRYKNGKNGRVHKLYSSQFAANRLRGVCDAAKNAGVSVYTIGFEVKDNWMHDLLKGCASSSDQYFDPSGTQISDVFSAIAHRISPLRLVN